MKGFRIAVLLVLLVVTHGALYLLGKGTGHGEGGAAAADEAGAQAGSLPGKSGDREKAGAAGPAGGFRRLLADLERPDSGLTREEFLAARAELFRDWLRHDLRSAMDLLFRPENTKRHGAVVSTLYADLDEAIARHPEEVAEWLAARRYGSNTGWAATCWVGALLESGQSALVLEHLGTLPAYMNREAFEDLAKLASKEQLVTMRALMDKPELAEALTGSPRDAYARRKLQLAGGDPTALFEGEENGAIRESLLESWVYYGAFALPPEQAVADVMKFPEELRGEAMLGLAGQGRRGGYAAMAQLLDAMDARDLIGDVSGKLAYDLIQKALTVGGEGPESSFTSAADWLEQARHIRRDDLRHEFLHRTTGEGGYSKLTHLLGELPSLPRGADLDALISGVAAVPNIDGESRERLLAAVTDPAVLAELRKAIAAHVGEVPGDQ